MENKSLAEMMGDQVEEVSEEVVEETTEGGDEGDPGKGEKDGAPPAQKPSDDEENHVPRKALIEERRRRQEAERELIELRAKQKPKEEETRVDERPDEDVDPEGAAAWDAKQQWARDFQIRCDITRDTLMEIKGEDDYLEKETAFLKEAEQDPRLLDALRKSSNPAKFAYTEGAKILERAEYSDIEKVREKIRAEIEAEIGDDLEAYRARKAAAKAKPGATVVKQHERAKPKPNVPKSLADVSSSSPRDPGKSFDGPTPLSQLLP